MKFTLFVFEPFDKFVIELNEVICVKVLNIISVIGIDIVVDTDFLAWEIGYNLVYCGIVQFGTSVGTELKRINLSIF